MLKRIPKSDISIRPFKAYKEWSFQSGSSDISVLEANVSSSESSNGFQKNSIYGQLRAQFYNGNENNPFTRTGHKSNSYTTAITATERYLSGSAKVISIPQIYVGEGIKKGSFTLIDDSITYQDDSNGNLQDYRDLIYVSNIAIQTGAGYMNFTDILNTEYTAIIDDYFIDLSSGIMNITYNGTEYNDIAIISFDMENGIMRVDNLPFLPLDASGVKIGNVFYNQGLVTITRDSNIRLNPNWQISYKSTKTIYEHEYLLIVNEDEFNISQNPTAIVEVGKEIGFVSGSDGKIYKTTTNSGVKYIRKKSTLENGNQLDYRYTSSVSSSTHFAGFEHWDLSGSVDSTGSFLAPFITTIGLYDDNCDLVAVAKLPQPIKSEPDIPVNFIIRFDI